MAGMGFDAAIMAGASHELKSRLGPLAYFISGMRALRGPRARSPSPWTAELRAALVAKPWSSNSGVLLRPE
jgi:diacylglycerol kinase (ATP)